jgi:hypothetical protein
VCATSLHFRNIEVLHTGKSAADMVDVPTSVFVSWSRYIATTQRPFGHTWIFVKWMSVINVQQLKVFCLQLWLALWFGATHLKWAINLTSERQIRMFLNSDFDIYAFFGFGWSGLSIWGFGILSLGQTRISKFLHWSLFSPQNTCSMSCEQIYSSFIF